MVQRLLGLRNVPDLGLLTTSITTTTNAPIVHWSSTLLGYGSKFRFQELARAGNPIRGMAMHWFFSLLPIVLMLAPARWIVRRLLYKAGEGPSRDATERDRIEYRAVATADSDSSKHAYAKASFEGSMYDLTGLFLATGAITLLRDQCHAVQVGGGFMTAATLGQGFIDRAKEGGMRLEVALEK